MAITVQQKIKENEQFLNSLYVEREDAIHGMPLALYSNSNILLLGPPGTAKSALIRGWAKAFGGTYFEWLVTKFSTPDELFGPISAKGLEEDDYRRVTLGKLPESDFAFIDEVFKANSGILNSLLTIMNERLFPNGRDANPNIPLKLMIGASNEIPAEDDGLDAMYDRFQFKYRIGYINDSAEFKKALGNDYSLKIPHTITQAEIQKGMKQIQEVTYDENIVNFMIDIKRSLEQKTIVVTDRTWVKAVHIMKTEAFLRGRNHVSEEDFEILKNVLWSKPEDERIVHIAVLTVTLPEKARIIDTYEKAVDVYKKFKESSKKQSDKSTLGLDTMDKIGAAIKKIEGSFKQLRERGKNLDSLQIYSKKLQRMNQEVVKEVTGMSVSTTTESGDLNL